MIDINAKQHCAGCSACANICPRRCIEMTEDAEGFSYPVVDQINCIDCGLCEKTCPVSHPAPQKPFNDAYAAISQDEATRRESSSGGVFSLLAEAILAENGVVFGARLDKNFAAVHAGATTPAELATLRKSKYVQSRVERAFQEARQYLRQGRKVLFSGTGCQIGGLLAYLGRDDENLVTLDIVCHGVPSPLVWRNYLALRQKNSGAIAELSFRSKSFGWKNYALRIAFQNQTVYEKSRAEDPYLRAFLQNLYLRPSCHACAFKTERRVSDITLADYWGVRRVFSDMDDRKGTSLIIVHSPAGRALLDAIKPRLTLRESRLSDAIQYNPAYLASAPPHPNRAQFFAALPHLAPEQLLDFLINCDEKQAAEKSAREIVPEQRPKS